MSKVIKYRIWDFANESWCEESSFWINGKGVMTYVDNIPISNEEYSIELYIGMNDINGVEIYENDYVHIWSDFYKKDMPKALVFWNEKTARFDIKTSDGNYHDWLMNARRQGWFIEILGNFHYENDI